MSLPSPAVCTACDHKRSEHLIRLKMLPNGETMTVDQ